MTDVPYGLWRRNAARSELDPVERRSRDADEAWDLRHSEDADRLDALIGRTVVLKKAREGFPDPETGEGRVYPKGCQFVVKGRVRGVLLVALVGDEATTMMLDPDWIRTVEKTG